jgi:hypothetical protein
MQARSSGPSRMQECTSQLELGDVVPIWQSRLERPLEAGHRRMLWHLRMASPESCIVGEACGFSSSYVNNNAASAAFSQAFLDAFTRDWGALQKTAGHFMSHCGSEHKDVTAGTKRKLMWYDAFIRSDDYVLTYVGR